MSVEEVTGKMTLQHLIQAPLMYQPFKKKQSTITFIYLLSKKHFIRVPLLLPQIHSLGQ